MLLEPLMTMGDLLKYFRIGRTAFWHWRRKRNFPKPLSLGERSKRWRQADVIAWAEAQGELTA